MMRRRRLLPCLCCTALVLAGLAGCAPDSPTIDAPAVTTASPSAPAQLVPDWAADAVFYQIFPERFRNGDPANDPTRASLEWPEQVSAVWRVSPWTGDWYARADWERTLGPDFYENGVFHRRYGGDLQGVIDRLDYLDSLGVNTLYFNPVFYARSLHKYDGSSYHHVDPFFGPDPAGDLALIEAEQPLDPGDWVWTEADKLFLRLLDEAHARGIRVIIDGVWNHTGMGFFAFQDLLENQRESPYADWYVVKTWDDPATPDTNEFDHQGWWDFKPLPVLADTPDGVNLHPGPRGYIFDATRRWMDPDGDGDPSDGIDGWRLDVTQEVPLQFWAEWNALVRDLNPAAYTVSEIWEDASDYLPEAGFSATMNYWAFAHPVKGFLIDRTLSPSAFVTMLDARRTAYPEAMRPALQNLIDSHDTDRLASMIVNARTADAYLAPERFDYDWGEAATARGGNTAYALRAPNDEERARQRLVVLFQMTYVGAPMVYYGDEAGMWGGDDPDDRKPMVWPDLAYEAEASDPLGRPRTPDPVAFDHDLFAFYRDAIALRNEHAAFRQGAFEVLAADDERGIVVFRRMLGDEEFVVVLNPGDEAHSMRVPVPGGITGRYELVLITADEPYRVQQDAEALLLEVSGRSGFVLQRRPMP